ncbi:MAG TPA: hypothetical protein VGU27_04210, partial [Candidatus Eisenbacteria bacterium]|nr:hypothetical protein [Candidatus Eisenbacteria bacterium]
MGMPEPVEPEPRDGADKAADRADWLVGPEEGLAAEAQHGPGTPRIVPVLRRPGAEGGPSPSAPDAHPPADPRQEDLFGAAGPQAAPAP